MPKWQSWLMYTHKQRIVKEQRKRKDKEQNMEEPIPVSPVIPVVTAPKTPQKKRGRPSKKTSSLIEYQLGHGNIAKNNLLSGKKVNLLDIFICMIPKENRSNR